MSTESLCQQLSLPLFINPSFEEVIDLKKISGLSVKLSTRLKRGWYLNIDRNSGNRTLTIPQYLQSAPSDIKNSLIQWSILAQYSRRSNSAVKSQRVSLEKKIQTYIRNLSPELYRSTLDTTRLDQQTKGIRFDLREIFDDINVSYFKNSVTASLRWGAPGSLTSYQTVRTAKDGNAVNLITIAGVYNHPDVPRFALDAVMYHEMLHIVIPPYIRNGRRVVHGPEFKSMERQYTHYKQWCEWERKCLRALARRLRKMHLRTFKT